MANKPEKIAEKLTDEIINVSKSVPVWESFLRTAAYSYKYSFLEQILIYSQKPQATAVADIEFWNKRCGRWVNRGAKGIALLDYSGEKPRLRYVFDVSDTNSREEMPAPIWRFEDRFSKEVCEALTNAFGAATQSGVGSVIVGAAVNLAKDNVESFFEVLQSGTVASALEKTADNDLRRIFKNILSSSVGYMMLQRCSLPTEQFYDAAAFKDIEKLGVAKPRILQEIKNRKRQFTRIRGTIQSKIHFSNTESIVGLNEKF